MFVFVEFHVIYFDGINMRGRNQRRKEKVGNFVGYGCFVLLCKYRWAFIDFHWINDKYERENHPGSYSATQTTWLDNWSIPVKNTPCFWKKWNKPRWVFASGGFLFYSTNISPVTFLSSAGHLVRKRLFQRI